MYKSLNNKVRLLQNHFAVKIKEGRTNLNVAYCTLLQISFLLTKCLAL